MTRRGAAYHGQRALLGEEGEFARTEGGTWPTMASGFIILRDGRCLSLRHAVHDAVLRSIATGLDSATAFQQWLAAQVPGATDADLGHAFVRAADGAHVSRELDTRSLTAPNQKLFERAAREAKPIPGPFAPAEDVDRGLQRLRKMLDSCDAGRPALELSDWTVEAPPCQTRVGPGWVSD